MAKLYQDNMAIVRKFGRPDLFITFTCNPNWKEIKDQLKGFQNASDRADIVVRVFNLKLKQLIDDICKIHLFGNVLAYVYVIEYQKRGLPHAHILITLSSADKLRNGDIDNMVSAEIPCPLRSKNLYDVIMKHNIHNPCGSSHKANAVCLNPETGKCSKEFPKPFRSDTFSTSDGYPKYKRVDNTASNHVLNSNIRVHNGWVVPYNPFLSLKYDAHINVEICTSIKAIKYIHKYITKGQDCARIGVQVNDEGNITDQVNYDEINQYLNCRYLSAHEAVFRLFQFHTHKQSHNVFLLGIHLEGGESVIFDEDATEEALRNSTTKLTTLTAFFKLNLEENLNILYQEIPTKYLYKKNVWEKRSDRSHFGDKCIGRISSISPRNVELYHLRLLLLLNS